MPVLARLLPILAALLPAAGTGLAGERLSGPVPAELVRVIDGDTLSVRARIWLGLDMSVNVRIRAIDAPERRGRCEEEKRLAIAASEGLARLSSAGSLFLTDISADKFGGRIVANVSTAEGNDLGTLMRTAGHARPYDSRKRESWCAAAKAE